MPILRENVRVRDQPAGAHPAAAPGHPRAVPLLPPQLHQEQHGAETHRPGAQTPDQPQADPRQVREQAGAARPALPGPPQPVQRAPQQLDQSGSSTTHSPGFETKYQTSQKSNEAAQLLLFMIVLIHIFLLKDNKYFTQQVLTIQASQP